MSVMEDNNESPVEGSGGIRKSLSSTGVRSLTVTDKLFRV